MHYSLDTTPIAWRVYANSHKIPFNWGAKVYFFFNIAKIFIFYTNSADNPISKSLDALGFRSSTVPVFTVALPL